MKLYNGVLTAIVGLTFLSNIFGQKIDRHIYSSCIMKQVSNEHVLNIKVEESSIKYKNEIVQIEDVCDILSPFLLEGVLLNLTIDKNVLSPFYVDVSNIIHDCYKGFIDNYSEEIFFKSFVDLSEEQKNSIDEMKKLIVVEKLGELQ